MVALRIRGFVLDRDNMPIVMLAEESGQRVLPIWIGPSEASAIIVELEKIRPPEPLTHDLLAVMFLQHGLRMERLEIYRQPGRDACAARIVYRRRFRRCTLETRPSDGLALAVRLGAPILGEEELLASSQFPSCLHGGGSRSLLFLKTPAEGPMGERVTFN